MPFLEHLEQLRWHIIRSLIAVGIFAVVIFIFRKPIMDEVILAPYDSSFPTHQFLCDLDESMCFEGLDGNLLENRTKTGVYQDGKLLFESKRGAQGQISITTLGLELGLSEEADADSLVIFLPGGKKQKIIKPGSRDLILISTNNGGEAEMFQALTPYEQFLKALSLAFFGGLIVAFPYIASEFWRFIKPGLRNEEVKKARGFNLAVSFLFFTGIAFGYFIVSPFAARFLYSFELTEKVVNHWQIGKSVSLVIQVCVAAGFMFQLPVVSYFLTRIGLLTPMTMRKYRKHSLVALLFISALITPPDWISQIAIFIPLTGLYEISILISKSVYKKREKEFLSKPNSESETSTS